METEVVRLRKLVRVLQDKNAVLKALANKATVYEGDFKGYINGLTRTAVQAGGGLYRRNIKYLQEFAAIDPVYQDNEDAYCCHYCDVVGWVRIEYKHAPTCLWERVKKLLGDDHAIN
jgi:hypothetical protein